MLNVVISLFNVQKIFNLAIVKYFLYNIVILKNNMPGQLSWKSSGLKIRVSPVRIWFWAHNRIYQTSSRINFFTSQYKSLKLSLYLSNKTIKLSIVQKEFKYYIQHFQRFINNVIIIKYRLGCLGLEPRTNRLKAEYSTIELATLNKY